MSGQQQPKVTTEQILIALRYFTADEMRQEQKKLTATSNQLRELAIGKLRGIFSPDELDTLKQAAALVASLGARVEHAKEIRSRDEKRQKAQAEARSRRIAEAVAKLIPKPACTPQALLYLAELSVGLKEAGVILSYLSMEQLAAELLDASSQALRSQDQQLMRRVVSRVYHDIERGVEEYLHSRPDSGDELDEFRAKLKRLDEGREEMRRRYHHALFDPLRTLLAIATADNVAQLPTKR